MTADRRHHSLVVAVDATVACGGLRFLASCEGAAALCLLHLPSTRYTERGPEGLGGFRGVLVLLLLSRHYLMSEWV